MHVGHRVFLLDQDDELYRLPSATFVRMYDDPTSHSIPRFADTRIRMSGVSVELVDRRPTRVIRTTFNMLAFLDRDAYQRHQWARAEAAFAPVFNASGNQTDVVAAEARFVAQGGRWTPSPAVAKLIEQAVLGLIRYQCP